MRRTLHIGALGAGLLLAVWTAACGSSASSTNGITVARVGDTTISKLAFEHWSTIVPAGTAGPNDPARTREALSLLLLAAWTEGEARDARVTVSADTVNNATALLRTAQSENMSFEEVANAPFFSLIGRPGETAADRTRLMKLNLLALRVEERRLRDAERQIPAAQVARYYAEHRAQFVVPEQRDLEVIGNEKESIVAQAKREVEAGASFISVAKRLSEDSEAPGGLQLRLQRGQEEPEYEQHVFSARPGVLYGPIRQIFYYIFEVLRIRPAHLQPLAQVQESIRRELVATARKGLVARWRQRDVREWTARTRCRAGYAAPRCGRTL
jgi:PPIC-type PPIASE domain